MPFTYSAEAFPLHVRDVGMSWATATTWYTYKICPSRINLTDRYSRCFNFIISFTWPSLRTAFTNQGAFSWYAAWCLIGWVLVLLFVPETKGISHHRFSSAQIADNDGIALTLEELDQVFSVSTRKHASYQIKNCIWHFKTWVLRQKLEPLPPFYQNAEHLKGGY